MFTTTSTLNKVLCWVGTKHDRASRTREKNQSYNILVVFQLLIAYLLLLFHYYHFIEFAVMLKASTPRQSHRRAPKSRTKPRGHSKPSTPHTAQMSTRAQYDLDQLMTGISKNDRRQLARAITLIESTKSEHNDLANTLLRRILEYRVDNPAPRRSLAQWQSDDEFLKSKQIPTFDEAEAQNKAYPNLQHRHKPMPAILEHSKGLPRGPLRIGVSGTPGVGKSTFLEHFGMHLIEKYGLRVAVLSVDPSSLITGGSILGDKTRMQRLSLEDNAYIRPTPSKGILGGIAQNTAEVITLLEHANYDIIFVETVGVGQSEVHVSQVTDMLLMLMNVSGGDELQGIKKGMMEMCDIMVVTKADGDLYNAAARTKADYSTALQMYTRSAASFGWSPRVLLSSIKEDKERYMDSIWGTILDYEHCLLQPISNLSPQTLDRLHFLVDRAPPIQHNHHANDSGQLFSETVAPVSSISTVTTNNSDNQEQTLLEVKRANQRVQWMWSQINQTIMAQFKDFVVTDKDRLPAIQMRLIQDRVTPRIAAKESFDAYIQHSIEQAQAQTKNP